MGDDAKAWCRSTDDLRGGDAELGIKPDTESQAACDEIE